MESIEIERPDRWDHPLDADMSAPQVAALLARPPFSEMNAERFASRTPLESILRNDTRVLECDPGDILFREGQYGGSAYLVLDGDVRIFLNLLLSADDAMKSSQWSGAQFISWFRRRKSSSKVEHEQRRQARRANRSASKVVEPVEIGSRGTGAETRIFLQDVPRAINDHATARVQGGELFGELAAVTRSPREFTAVAETACTLLEIRWQGLKLLKQDPEFRRLLDERYRSEVLRSHLRETMLFRFIPEEHLDSVVMSAKLESFGNLEWYADYRKRHDKPAKEQIESEPLIAAEGSYATGLWIIRGGFARLSRRQGVGHRTLAYFGKGHMFGLREIAHNYHMESQAAPLPYQESLRAIGYVDALCIPKQTVNQHILPFIRQADLPSRITAPHYQFGQPVIDAPLDTAEQSVETGLLEFLVERRLMNGRKTMVINTERCTRCDDCVRACASTHDGTPVFERQGAQYGNWMFTQSCMHCEDPVCMIGCPTGAIHRDNDSGLVKINDQTCIGCKGCAESCPYDNIRMVTAVDGKGRAKVDASTGQPILKASKCDFCADGGGKPACQTACPHGALVRLDLSNVAAISAELGGAVQ